MSRIKSFRLWGVTCVCLGLLGLLGAIPVAEAKLKLRFGGKLESNLFVGLNPPAANQPVQDSNLGRFFDYRNSNSLFLQMSALFNNRFSGKARVQIRNVNFSEAKNAVDLELYEQQFPVSLRLYELYMDFNELFGFIDLRIGQQRIAWGTGLAFNPTDNLNPYNLENPLDFTERLPVPAISASFYTPEEFFKLTIVGVPFFVPSVVPFRLFKEAIAIDSPIPTPPSIKVQSYESIERPAARVENFQFGAKAAFTLPIVNVSASYFLGNMLFPVQEKVHVREKGFLEILKNGKTNVDVVLVYPRAHVVGLDLSASIPGLGIGIWGEFSVTIPTRKVDLILTQANPEGEDKEPVVITKDPLTQKTLPVTSVLRTDPFLKATVGLDYTFPGGLYLVLQYIYGFFNQQNADELHHFAFTTLRKTFFRGKLLVQLTAIGELDVTKDSGPDKDGKAPSWAGLLNPEIQIKPIDSASIIIGGVISRGDVTTTLYLFQELAQVYLRARMKF